MRGDDSMNVKIRQRSTSRSSPVTRRKNKLPGKGTPGSDQRLMSSFIKKRGKGVVEDETND